MNLIDAIKSGKPFRRPDQPWYGGMPNSFRVVDILADDWEIQEPTVTITASQFWSAVNASTHVALGQDLELDRLGITKLARFLGLEAK